jgi:hypothetical protein
MKVLYPHTTRIFTVYDTENLFKVIYPDAYECKVESYTISHSALHISALPKDAHKRLTAPAFSIYFVMVTYFSGLLRWNGAGFRVASEQQYFDLMSNIGNPNIGSWDRLYEVGNIKIIAAHAVWLGPPNSKLSDENVEGLLK